MYQELKEKALSCRTWEDVDALLKSIEEDSRVSDRAYYAIKHLALDAVYAYHN